MELRIAEISNLSKESEALATQGVSGLFNRWENVWRSRYFTFDRGESPLPLAIKFRSVLHHSAVFTQNLG